MGNHHVKKLKNVETNDSKALVEKSPYFTGEYECETTEETEENNALYITSPYFLYEPIDSRNLEIVGFSRSITSKKVIIRPHRTIFPDDMLKLIFLKLTIFELWNASLVCLNWHYYLMNRR